MKNVAVVVAHPDDTAVGLGGTALLLAEAGYRVHSICATRGELGLAGKDPRETGERREKEERASCALIPAEPYFLDMIDQDVYASREVCEKVACLLKEISPVAVFTIWPIDNHVDHSATGEITMKAVRRSGIKTEIIFCEESPNQTCLFSPDHYVDISSKIDLKMELIRCHRCQNVNDGLASSALKRAERRGAEAGFSYAEAFKSLAAPDKSLLKILMKRR